MTTNTKVRWQGSSGQAYSYSVHPINESWKDTPGNYIFAGYDRLTERWVPLYIGETGSLKDRLSPISSHAKAACASRNGMTHIHAHVASSDPDVRRTEESDLTLNWSPVCNG